MADSFVQLSVDSTGKKIDTRTEGTNSEHRQVYVIGDPVTNAGVAPVDATKGLAVDLTATGANTTALKVDGSAVTQPVSLATLPVTNAGTFAVQATLQTQTDTVMVGGVNVKEINAITPLMGAGNTGTGSLRVTVASDQAVIPISDNAGSLTVDQATGTNLHTVLDSGTLTTLTTLTGTTTLTPGVAAANLGKAEDAAHVSSDTGVMALAVRSNTAASTSGTDGDYQPLITNTTGHLWVDASGQSLTVGTHAVTQSGTWTVQPGNTANTTPWLVSEQPTTAGGVLTYSFLSTAAVQSAQIKGSAGQVYGLHFFNNTGTICYVRIYNQTGAPATTDTANIVWRGIIPANTSGAGFIIHMEGTACGTGIGIRATAAVADNDNTALAANAIIGNVLYK